MGLFSKKTCAICGGEIGMLGNKKLADGDMCKECNAKLSIWFDDRKNSTVEQIKSQLASREENRERLKTFKTTRAYGEFGVILIDEENRQFAALADTSDGLFKNAKTVTSIDEIADKNPDIISFDQIVKVKVNVRETSREEKHTVNNEQVSYDPKHYTYMNSFDVEVHVNHPYIGLIMVPLNNGSIHIYTEEPRQLADAHECLQAFLRKCPELKIENQAEVYTHNTLKDRLLRTEYDLPDYSYGFRCTRKNWDDIKEYQYYLAMAYEIKDVLES